MTLKQQKIALRQRQKHIDEIVTGVMNGSWSEKDFLTPQHYQDYKEAVATPPLDIQAIMDSTYPLAIENIKNKVETYLLAPVLKVTRIIKKGDVYLIRGTAIEDIGTLKKGVSIDSTAFSFYEGIGGVYMSTNGKILSQQTEKVIIEKEIEKKVKLGYTEKQIDKAINQVMHTYKNSIHEQGHLELFKKFKEILNDKI